MKQFSEKIARKGLLSIIIVFFSMISYAATYYVSPTGNDTSGNGSISSPWFTLNKAWTVVAAGDIVYMRGGTYRFNTQQSLTGKNGTSGNLIKVFAYPGETPVLTKSSSYTQVDGKGLFFSGNYVHFKGLEITGYVQINNNNMVAWGFRAENSSYCIFELLKVHGNGCGLNIANLGYTAHCTGNLVLNSDFYNNQDPLTLGDPYGNADGLSFTFITHAEDSNTVRGCRFWRNSDDGVDFFNNEGFILIENCWAFDNGYLIDSFSTAGNGLGFKWGDSADVNRTTTKRISRNNVAVRNRQNGFGTNDLYGVVEMYNCTAYLNGNIGIHLADFNLQHKAINCISYANGTNFGPSTNGTYTTNSWQNGLTISNADFASLDVSLLLAARQSDGSLPVTNLLRLAPTSKLINAGTNVGISYIGSGPDLGAFESGSESGSIDTTRPVVTSFGIPSSSTSLTISVSNFTATDDIGVTGYLLTETSATPSSTTAGWSSTKTSYVFSSTGSKMLYAWAKDAAGNVSAPLSASITISSPGASSYTLTGPSSGNVNSASANFIVTPNNLYTGTITLTPSGTGSAGLSAKVLTFTNSSVAQTFTITPTVAGSIVLTATNNGGLTNPANLTYNSNAIVPGAPTSVVAAAGNKTATVTFVAPSSNGGSSINGYTVTSVPAGGIDTNAGSTSLKHTISGLTNGVSYTFTVKATNSAGSSVSSAASNTVTPTSSSSIEYKSICEGSSYNGWTVTGKYSKTLTTKTGGDSIVTTYLTVNPKFVVNEDVTINSGETYNGWNKSGKYTRTLTSVSGCDSIVTTNLTVAAIVDKGEAGTSHFIPVWQGENGQNHMNFIVVSAIMEDIPLTVNDEIAVFSGSICVGAKRLSQTIRSTDNTTFLSFVASMSDGTNNGFTSNDTIIFKIWNNQSQTEMVAKKVIYQKDLAAWLTTGRYASGATSVVEIESFSEFTQTIELIKGYNLFSTYVAPTNSDMGVVTKPLRDDGRLVKIQDEAGNSYEYLGSFGGWSNKIGNVQKTEGYRIRVNSNSSFQVTGRQITLPLDIPLQAGWNFISFPRVDQVDAMAVVQALISQNKLIKVLDEQGNSIENWGKNGGWRNNIGNLTPGKGYKINVSSNAVLTIQQSYPKSAVILAKSGATEYFSTKIDGNSSDHMNVNIVGLRASGMSVGDELAAFDGRLCVGTLKITEDNLSGDAASLIASFSTDEQNQNGFKEGNQIQIYAWNKLTGDESQVLTTVLSGQMTYAKSASVLVNIQSLSTGMPGVEDVVSIEVFPNPSQGKFTVRFSELPDVGGRIDVADLSGRKIISRSVTETSEEFNLSHLAPGLYLVKSVLGLNETIHKLIINK